MIVIPIKSKTYGAHDVFIDGEDFDKIKNYTWGIHNERRQGVFRAKTRIVNDGKIKVIYMQKLIIECPDGMVIDHINRNPLDNRKEI